MSLVCCLLKCTSKALTLTRPLVRGTTQVRAMITGDLDFPEARLTLPTPLGGGGVALSYTGGEDTDPYRLSRSVADA
jgi:hypothetical protein